MLRLPVVEHPREAIVLSDLKIDLLSCFVRHDGLHDRVLSLRAEKRRQPRVAFDAEPAPAQIALEAARVRVKHRIIGG